MKVGLAYRPEFREMWSDLCPYVEIVEVMPELYLDMSNSELAELRRFFDGRELRAHSLSLNLAGSLGPRPEVLTGLARVLDGLRIETMSDHFSFMSVTDAEIGNFVPPLPGKESMDLILSNLSEAQNALGRKLQLENIVYFLPWSDYLSREASMLSEAGEAGSGILLDVNNLFVNSRNHGFDAVAYLKRLRGVRQIHMAGHRKARGYLVDSHMDPICQEVLDLARTAMSSTEADALILERDNNSADAAELIRELKLLKGLTAPPRKPFP